MLVIVEGVDRTGKTSLVEALKERCGGRVIHWGAPIHNNPVDEYLTPLQSYHPRSGMNLFLDRHYLGELVWSHIFYRDSLFTPDSKGLEALAQIEIVLHSLGVLPVLAVREEVELELACRDEPCANKAAMSQRRFQLETSRSMLTWREYSHGDDLDRIIQMAEATEELTAVREENEKLWTQLPLFEIN